MLNNDLPFSTGIFKMDKVDKRSKSKQDIHHVYGMHKKLVLHYSTHILFYTSHITLSVLQSFQEALINT